MQLRSGRIITYSSVSPDNNPSTVDNPNMVASILSQMIIESQGVPGNVDPLMHKMRMIITMYKYVNSVPESIMTSQKLSSLCRVLLKKGKQFSIDGEKEIKHRIEVALSDTQLLTTRGEEGIRQYYNLHLEYMQDELTKFDETYGKYL